MLDCESRRQWRVLLRSVLAVVRRAIVSATLLILVSAVPSYCYVLLDTGA